MASLASTFLAPEATSTFLRVSLAKDASTSAGPARVSMGYNGEELFKKPLTLLRTLARQQGIPITNKNGIIDALVKSPGLKAGQAKGLYTRPQRSHLFGAQAPPSSRGWTGCACSVAADPAPSAVQPPSFTRTLRTHGLEPVLRRKEVKTVQINVGLYCNQACAHCHVDSSPLRTEMMDRPTAQRIVDLIARSGCVETVDLTGGAPELNPQFRFLVEQSRGLGKQVIDRCNLTVLLEPGQEDLAEFLRANHVRVVASLPCYSTANVDKQRGRGVFEKSIEALQMLNALGYGAAGSDLVLDLVYNPVGPTLPPPQAGLEEAYKSELWECYRIRFNSLLTIANMPINRFKKDLQVKGSLDSYMGLLAGSFNPQAVPSVMCTSLISVGWDGAMFDCDFNQQLDMGLRKAGTGTGPPLTVFGIDSFQDLEGDTGIIAVGDHCFGCTAGQGSSCTGALADASAVSSNPV